MEEKTKNMYNIGQIVNDMVESGIISSVKDFLFDDKDDDIYTPYSNFDELKSDLPLYKDMPGTSWYVGPLMISNDTEVFRFSVSEAGNLIHRGEHVKPSRLAERIYHSLGISYNDFDTIEADFDICFEG